MSPGSAPRARWPYPAPAASALLSLDLGRPRLSNRNWGAYTHPQLLLDGQPAPARWGYNELTVPPGRHLLAVSAVGRFATGEQSSIVFDAYPGQRLAIFYAASSFQSGQGAIGFAPVASPGRNRMLLIIIGPAAFGLLFALVILIALVAR
jgi:hypothetical protein